MGKLKESFSYLFFGNDINIVPKLLYFLRIFFEKNVKKCKKYIDINKILQYGINIKNKTARC